MADCKITFDQDKGFWIGEAFMQLALYYIYEEVKKPEYIVTEKNQFLMDLDFKINGYAGTYLTLGWKNFIRNNDDTQNMLGVLQNVKTYIQNKGDFLSIEELLKIKTEDSTLKYMFQKPFPTAELVRVFDSLSQMLEGTWTSTNYSMDLNFSLFD